jgi:hypothetical protein
LIASETNDNRGASLVVVGFIWSRRLTSAYFPPQRQPAKQPLLIARGARQLAERFDFVAQVVFLPWSLPTCAELRHQTIVRILNMVALDW